MIRVEYTPTYDDYRQLSIAVAFRRQGVLLAGLALAPILGATASILSAWGAGGPGLTNAPASTYVPLTVVAVFAYVIIPVQLLRSFRRRWDAAPQVREPRTYEFTDDGIRSRGESFDSRHSWALVKWAGVVRGMLTIETNQGAYHYLPRAALDSAQWTALRELIARHVPSARLPE